MKLHSFFIILCLFVITSGCSQPQKKNTTTKNSKDLKALNAYIESLEKEGVYGSFLLIEGGKILFEKSIGYANKEKGIKSSKSTIYPYGSIVKDYTRTILLLLASENKISLEDPLSKFYKNIPNDKKDITLAQLLQHRSGLQEYHDNDPELRRKNKGIPADFYPGTKEEALGYIFNQKLDYAPGTEESYSNSGYTLLAYLIEDITEKPFDVVVQEKILAPAQTTTADFYQSKLWKPEEVAVGYGQSSYGKENSPFYWPRNPNQLIGNGGMAGTLVDLYKGLNYIMSLEDTNEAYAKLAKKYKYIEDMPNDIVGSAGGGDMGNVALIFGIKSKGQYLFFASNNDDDGVEDVSMLRKVTILGFGFDVASLAPQEMGENGENDTERTKLSDKDAPKSKWGLPKTSKYEKIDAFLDLLSKQRSLDNFDQYCLQAFSKKLKKRYPDWPKSEAIKLKKIVSFGSEMELTIQDTISKKQHVYTLKLEPRDNFKFKEIKLDN